MTIPFLLCAILAGPAAEIHVAPAGDDSWSGQRDRPKATLAAAMAESRKLPTRTSERNLLQSGSCLESRFARLGIGALLELLTLRAARVQNRSPHPRIIR